MDLSIAIKYFRSNFSYRNIKNKNQNGQHFVDQIKLGSNIVHVSSILPIFNRTASSTQKMWQTYFVVSSQIILNVFRIQCWTLVMFVHTMFATAHIVPFAIIAAVYRNMCHLLMQFALMICIRHSWDVVRKWSMKSSVKFSIFCFHIHTFIQSSLIFFHVDVIPKKKYSILNYFESYYIVFCPLICHWILAYICFINLRRITCMSVFISNWIEFEHGMLATAKNKLHLLMPPFSIFNTFNRILSYANNAQYILYCILDISHFKQFNQLEPIIFSLSLSLSLFSETKCCSKSCTRMT